MLAIQTKELCKNYGQHQGIKDVSLAIEEGEIFGFIGPNGSGKSTTIRTLLGLLIPTSGDAWVLGQDIRLDAHKVRMSIGYLPSEVNYYDEMTSRELLEYHCRFYGRGNNDIDRLAALLELDLSKKIADLSFGNRKKCGIIQAIVHKPKLIIMDEPTSGLDPLMQQVFFKMLTEENKKGTTIFFSSHILSEVQNICHRAAIIRNGEIVATKHIQSILQKQMKRVVLLFAERPSDLNLPKGVQAGSWQGNTFTFEYVGPTNQLVQWIASIDIKDVAIEEPELEAIFMNYYQT